MDYTELNKEISYALRHAPWEYELEIYKDGWILTKVQDFLISQYLKEAIKNVNE